MESDILLTGSSGRLGGKIKSLKPEGYFLSPSHKELDICDYKSIDTFFKKHKINSIIHCAAISTISQCDQNPSKSFKTNVTGTWNLVKKTLDQEKKGNLIRFLHVSSDGVYDGEKGNYSEKDPPIPYSLYGLTKLGAECAVSSLSDYCTVRTTFYDSEKIKFKEAPTDSYTSAMEIKDLANALLFLLDSKYKGIINVGEERKSRYELFKRFNNELKPCKIKDLPFKIARDSSLNLSLWNSLNNFNKLL